MTANRRALVTAGPHLPRGRRRQIDWLIRKFGPDGIGGLARCTDREVRQLVRDLWPRYANAPDFQPVAVEYPVCLRCHQRVRVQWKCACTPGEAPLTERDDDPEAWDQLHGDPPLRDRDL